MTEQEWLEGNDPTPMLRLLYRNQVSERKWRLFAVACCRRVWHLLTDRRSRQAVEVAERDADAEATDRELERAASAAHDVWNAEMERGAPGEEELDEYGDSFAYTVSFAAYNVAIPVGWWGGAPAFVAPHRIVREAAADAEAEGAAQCALLREIFGNPFRPVTVDPAWRTPSVTAIPQAIHAERRFADMPILADALEEAGCNSREILDHCRNPGEHVRGCWALDLILEKS